MPIQIPEQKDVQQLGNTFRSRSESSYKRQDLRMIDKLQGQEEMTQLFPYKYMANLEQ